MPKIYSEDAHCFCFLNLRTVSTVRSVLVVRKSVSCNEEERFHGDQDCLVCGSWRWDSRKSSQGKRLPVRLNLKRHRWWKCQLSLWFIKDSGRNSLAFLHFWEKADHLGIKYISRTRITVKPKGCKLKKQHSSRHFYWKTLLGLSLHFF